MPDRAWKQFERWVCRIFGGERWWEKPEECKDTGIWAPEAKYREKLPKWLVGDIKESMMEQAERQARDDQIPVVILTERYMKRRNALAIMRVGDLLDWFVSEEDGPAGPTVDEVHETFREE